MLRWSNGIARHEMKWCTSSNAASAPRFGRLRDEMVFFRAHVEQTCLDAPEQHKREPRRPKPVPYTRIRRLRRPGNFWRFLAIFWCFFQAKYDSGQEWRGPPSGVRTGMPKRPIFSIRPLCVLSGVLLKSVIACHVGPPDTVGRKFLNDARGRRRRFLDLAFYHYGQSRHRTSLS